MQTEPTVTTDSELSGQSKRTVSSIIESLLVYGFLLLTTVTVLYPVLRASLSWRLKHDPPFMIYMSYIMERFNMIPYRDFFDVNMLGSYISYQMIGKVFGFTDAGYHRGDVALLLVLMVITAGILWRFGFRAVWAAGLIWGLVYMREGAAMTLQRDYLAVFPMALGLGAAVGLPRVSPQWRALLAGIGFGFAASIKPHMVLGLIPVILYLAEEESINTPGWRARFIALFWNGFQAGLGAMLPVLAYVGYLVYHGALGPFLDSAFNYVPLYAEMTGGHALLEPAARRAYVIDEFFQMGGRWQLLLIGFIGLAAGFSNLRNNFGERRVLGLLLMLVPAYLLYPAITGQFWPYHYFPLIYILSISAAIAFAPHAPGTSWHQRWVPMLLVVLVLCHVLQAHMGFKAMLNGGREAPKGGRVDNIAKYLKENMQPGDTVQPLDWVGGGMLQAMWYADAPPATKYLTYFVFFHHVDLPYIQNLRKDFLVAVDEAKPRFIIEWVPERGDWVKQGPRMAKRFPEAEAWIKEHYVKRQSGRGFVIHERNEPRDSIVATP